MALTSHVIFSHFFPKKKIFEQVFTPTNNAQLYAFNLLRALSLAKGYKIVIIFDYISNMSILFHIILKKEPII